MDFLAAIGYFAVFAVLIGSVLATMLGLPGNWLLLVVMIGYSYFTDFQILPLSTMLWLTGAILLGELIEFMAALLGAKRNKASRLAMFGTVCGGFAGAMIGTMILPLIGSVIGAAAGVFAVAYFVERHVTGDSAQAKQVAVGAMFGQLIGMLAKLCIAIGVVFAIFYHILPHLTKGVLDGVIMM